MKNKAIHDDLVAMINLYGVISVEDACTIINSYEKADLNPGTLYTSIQFEVLEANQMFLVNEYFMLEIFLDEFEYLDLIEAQEDLPYYQPSKKELLKYKEDLYQEETPELKALKEYIIKWFKGSKVEIVNYLDYLSYFLKDSFNIEDIPNSINEFGCTIPQNKFEEFIQLCLNAHMHTRLWQNRGYTNQELSEMKQNKQRS